MKAMSVIKLTLTYAVAMAVLMACGKMGNFKPANLTKKKSGVVDMRDPADPVSAKAEAELDKEFPKASYHNFRQNFPDLVNSIKMASVTITANPPADQGATNDIALKVVLTDDSTLSYLLSARASEDVTESDDIAQINGDNSILARFNTSSDLNKIFVVLSRVVAGQGATDGTHMEVAGLTFQRSKLDGSYQLIYPRVDITPEEKITGRSAQAAENAADNAAGITGRSAQAADAANAKAPDTQAADASATPAAAASTAEPAATASPIRDSL